MVIFCEHSNYLSGFKKEEEFLDQPNKYRVFKKDPAPRSFSTALPPAPTPQDKDAALKRMFQ
jgi:hypothetical protein